MALTVMVIQKAGRWRTVTLGNRRSLSTILLARSMTLGAMVVLVVLGALVPTAVRAESTYAYDAQPLSCVDTRVIDSGVDVPPQVTALQVGSASPLAATRGTSTTPAGSLIATNTALDVGGANFAQTTASGTFSSGGSFAGQSIDDVAGALQSGAMSVKDVPIQVIVQDGNTLILNTRSALALEQAGIPRSAWNVVNMSGDAAAQARLAAQLARNGLDSTGTGSVRITGGG